MESLKKAKRMLKFNKNMVEINGYYYHINRENEDYKCIIGQMACQAGIDIPTDINDKKIVLKFGAPDKYINEKLIEFRNKLKKVYGLTNDQLQRLQYENDLGTPNNLKILLKKYGLIPKNSKLEFIRRYVRPQIG